MRFALRALLGFALTLAFAAAGAITLMRSLAPDEPAAPSLRAERSVVAALGELERITATPAIRAYGEIRSWRTLQLRPPVGGRIVGLAPRFRDGGRVTAGTELFRIDPADYEARVAEARLALREAQGDVREAREGVRAAELELAAAQTRRDLRAALLDRQSDLSDRGFTAAAAVEEAQLALAEADQTVAGRAQALVTARLAVERAELAVERATLSLAEAERRLAETAFVAPFDGVLTGLDAALGDVVTANQTLGALIDPTALEAELRLSGAEFSRLLDDGGALTPATAEVTLALADRSLTVPGRVERAGAGVRAAGAGALGRAVFVRLDIDSGTVLRPGDFVTARIEEPPLADVAAVPAAAVTEDGRLLVVTDGRLREVEVDVLRRDGDEVVIGGAPFGSTYVTARTPQLAPGLLVRPGLGAAAAQEPEADAPDAGADDAMEPRPTRGAPG